MPAPRHPTGLLRSRDSLDLARRHDGSLSAGLSGHDSASAGVHVLLNGDMSNGAVLTGTHLFDGIIDGNIGCPALGIAQSGTAPSQTYTGVVTLAAGQYIDFTVDPQGWYAGDMTGLAATITTVPEPTSLSLLGCALAGMLVRCVAKAKVDRLQRIELHLRRRRV